MSAIRRNGNRASARNNISSPYRRTAPKKSSWSLTGWLSYLNPLRFRPTSPDEPEESSSEGESSESEPFATRSDAAQVLSARGRQMATNTANGTSVHPSQPTTSLQPPASRAGLTDANPVSTQFPESLNPEQNLRIASDFLRENLDRQITRVELEGVLSLIDKSKQVDKPERFRFSSTIPSTPPRGNSPLPLNDAANPFDISAKSPPRTKLLPRNPNGVYRWQGGGSAKANNRSRNRYTSPAFGPTPSSTSRIVLKSAGELSRTDSKRRRLDEPQMSAVPSGSSGNGPNGSSILRSPAPEPTPGRVSHAQSLPPVHPQPPTTPTPKATGASSSRLRLSVPPKPTAPAIPSPLRNAWSNNSPDASPPQPTRQTKTANFMTELIKEVTPPKKPDVSNPYQTASPVHKAGAVKPRPKRPRIVEKRPEPPKTKATKEDSKDFEKEYPPQAILEATLPKGSKRSRPPAHLEQAGASSPRKSPEELVPSDVQSELEEIEHVSKKSKPTLEGLGWSSSVEKSRPVINGRDAPIKEKDVDMSEMPPTTLERQRSPPPVQTSTLPNTLRPTSPTSPGTSRTLGSFKPTAPKEPSKLRFSYQPEPSTSFGTTSAPASAFPFVTSSTNQASLSTSSAKQSLDRPDESKIDPKQIALAKPLASLPSFTFPAVIPNPTPLDDLPAINQVKALPRSSLPTFDFEPTSSLAAKPFGSTSSSLTPTIATAPVQGFNWAAAGMKPPTAPAEGTWKCSVCMLENTADAINKCNTCDTPRPSTSTAASVPPKSSDSAPPAVSKGFDWTAAGMKPPAAPSDGEWICSTCSCSNPPTAMTKCKICEEPKSSASDSMTEAKPTPAPFSPPSVPVQAFNWAAAGMKMPSTPADQWECSTCSLSNPHSATKCTVCDSPR